MHSFLSLSFFFFKAKYVSFVVFVSALFYIRRLMVLGSFSADFMVENIYCEKEQSIPVILASCVKDLKEL